MATEARERWRINAMRTIQERALDLFDARGFDAVTIEEIAAAAEVIALARCTATRGSEPRT